MAKTFNFILKVTVNEDDPLHDYYDDVAKAQLKEFIVDELKDGDNLMEYSCEAM